MRKWFIILNVSIGLFSSCRKPYDLNVSGGDPGILVVEGTILVGSNQDNVFKLSRLNDLAAIVSETAVTNARVEIVSGNGNRWVVNEVSPGTYRSILNLNSGSTYQLLIQTSDGLQYSSEVQKVVRTPEIDSLSWRQEGDIVNMYAHTHDATNSTRYYRWSYEETWESHAWYETYFDFVNGIIIARPPGDQIYSCWKNASSNNVIVGSSTSLKDDVISYQPVTSLTKPSEKLYVRYSVLVRQIGLTSDAYDFWSLLKKNTELTGTLFDPQPSTLPTNLKCTTNPGKKVIGYVSAATVSEKRLFIRNSEVSLWPYRNESTSCPAIEKSKSQAEIFLSNNPDYLPAYYVTAGGNYGVAERKCVDCRYSGGTNVKPVFW
jgi:hypothetical protein